MIIPNWETARKVDKLLIKEGFIKSKLYEE